MAQADRNKQRVRAANGNATNTPRRTPSGFSGYILFFAGLALIAFGVGLLQPPTAVPHAEWIATKFSRLGVQGLPIIAAGMTIFCMGFVARLQARVGRALATTPEPMTNPELTRLAAEFGQLRGSLGNVQTELLANKQRQDSMLESIQTVTQQTPDTGDNSKAMFRLAASLDQLGARVGERLKDQAMVFDGRLADITTAIVRAQQELTEAVDQAEQRASEQVASLAIQETVSFEAPQAEATTEFFEDDLGFEENIEQESQEEELHITVELEEEVAAPVENSPLGLLDSLDDFGSLVEPNPPLPNTVDPSSQHEQTEKSWPPRND